MPSYGCLSSFLLDDKTNIAQRVLTTMVSNVVLAVSIIVIILASSATVAYLSPFTNGNGTTPTSSSTSSSYRSTSATSSGSLGAFEIVIPPKSTIPPPGFNITSLLTGTFHYKFNYTVVIGVNNSIVWVNNDTVDHTVTSFIIPNGAVQFNSGLIAPGGTFSTILVVPGEYRYTCAWHPFLAGEIRVIAATH
jgi:hypothetical protein